MSTVGPIRENAGFPPRPHGQGSAYEISANEPGRIIGVCEWHLSEGL